MKKLAFKTILMRIVAINFVLLFCMLVSVHPAYANNSAEQRSNIIRYIASIIATTQANNTQPEPPTVDPPSPGDVKAYTVLPLPEGAFGENSCRPYATTNAGVYIVCQNPDDGEWLVSKIDTHTGTYSFNRKYKYETLGTSSSFQRADFHALVATNPIDEYPINGHEQNYLMSASKPVYDEVGIFMKDFIEYDEGITAYEGHSLVGLNLINVIVDQYLDKVYWRGSVPSIGYSNLLSSNNHGLVHSGGAHPAIWAVMKNPFLYDAFWAYITDTESDSPRKEYFKNNDKVAIFVREDSVRVTEEGFSTVYWELQEVLNEDIYATASSPTQKRFWVATNDTVYEYPFNKTLPAGHIHNISSHLPPNGKIEQLIDDGEQLWIRAGKRLLKMDYSSHDVKVAINDLSTNSFFENDSTGTTSQSNISIIGNYIYASEGRKINKTTYGVCNVVDKESLMQDSDALSIYISIASTIPIAANNNNVVYWYGDFIYFESPPCIEGEWVPMDLPNM